MMIRPTVYVDFHNADSMGRVRLNCIGTTRDLDEKRITLTQGMQLTLTDDDLETEGEVYFGEEERIWVAVVDWNAIRDRVARPVAMSGPESGILRGTV